MTAPLRKLHDSEGWALTELARMIREAVGDDDQAFLDSLDGEGDAVEAARAVVRWIAECEAHEASMKALAATYTARAKVHGERIPSAKAALLRFLNTIEERSLALPEATITVKALPAKVLGEPDPDALPDALVKIKRQPDMAAIKAALENGQTVDGCSLSNGGETLQLRRA